MGRRQFESVVAQAEKVALKYKEIRFEDYINGTLPGLANGGGRLIFDIYSSPGTRAELVDLFFKADLVASTATGSHCMNAYAKNDGVAIPTVIQLYQPATKDIVIQGNVFREFLAGSLTVPQTEIGQITAIRGMQFDDSKAIRFNYYNYSGQTYGGLIQLCLIYKEIEVR